MKRSTSALRRRAFDRLAQIIVTLGGTAVILSIIGMFVFLIKEVVPLFLSPYGTQRGHFTGALDREEPSQSSLVGLDEYQESIYLLSGGAQRQVRFFNAQSGAPIAVELPAGLAAVDIVSIARAAGSGHRFAVATTDGRLTPVTIEFTSGFDQGERRITPTIELGSPMQVTPVTERIARSTWLLEFRPDSEAQREQLRQVAASHAKLRLTQRHHELFLEALVRTLGECYGEGACLEAWRETVAPALEFMWQCQVESEPAARAGVESPVAGPPVVDTPERARRAPRRRPAVRPPAGH